MIYNLVCCSSCHQIARLKVAEKSYNFVTRTAETRRVETTRRSQRSRASNVVLLTLSRAVREVRSSMALKLVISWLLLQPMSTCYPKPRKSVYLKQSAAFCEHTNTTHWRTGDFIWPRTFYDALAVFTPRDRCSSRSSVSEEQLIGPSMSVCLSSHFYHGDRQPALPGSLFECIVAQQREERIFL
jgi:hypothetical protein